MNNKRNIIIVSGLSGAGKTTTMSIFEDMNYVPIDNLPHELLNQFVQKISNDESGLYEKVVLGVNITYFNSFFKAIMDTGLIANVILLTTSVEELLRRYNYNRRTHPLLLQGKAKNDLDAIAMEQEYLNQAVMLMDQYSSHFKHFIIDTTHLTKRQLISEIEMHKEIQFNYQLSIIFQSFGFRKGIPIDADYVFDVRFLDNPYWEVDLRVKTGEDQEVVDYIKNDAKYDAFFHSLVLLIDNVIKGNLNMDRSSLTIAIGCTGGQHRSVAIACELYKHYLQRNIQELFNISREEQFSVSLFHRDMEENLKEIMAKEAKS